MFEFSIRRAQTASFDVDAQCGFTPLCPNELPVPGGDEIAAALNEQATYAKYRIGSKDAHSQYADWVETPEAPNLTPIDGHANMDCRWHRHCEVGTPGFELLPGLPHPMDYDFFVYKGVEKNVHPYGACYHDLHDRVSTGVTEFLATNGVDVVIVGGLATDFCVKSTVLQLLDADYAVIVNLKACRGLVPALVAAALEEMRDYGARIVDDLFKVRVE